MSLDSHAGRGSRFNYVLLGLLIKNKHVGEECRRTKEKPGCVCVRWGGWWQVQRGDDGQTVKGWGWEEGGCGARTPGEGKGLGLNLEREAGRLKGYFGNKIILMICQFVK